MCRPQWRQRVAVASPEARDERVDKTPSPERGPQSGFEPLVGAVAVAKRAEVLDVEANLWL
jgi:hypothetical protein